MLKCCLIPPTHLLCLQLFVGRMSMIGFFMGLVNEMQSGLGPIGQVGVWTVSDESACIIALLISCECVYKQVRCTC